MVLDVSYVGNALRHGYGQAIDGNAVRPLTTWTPETGAVAKFKDPTSSGFYSTALIRAMVGYSGYNNIPVWTYIGTNNYNALQVQLNRRMGKLKWNANYTFSRTITYSFNQWVNTQLGKNVTNRPHAVNFNMGYDLPMFSSLLANPVGKQILGGWHINGDGAIFSGSPYTVGCGSTNAPIGYWTGTPTGGVPFRCQMGTDIFLPAGTLPSKTEDPRLQVPLNAANFTLPGINSLGIGNTPPTLFYGPGVINLDFSLAKSFKIAESKSLEMRVETFNTLNHFNPNNPNTGLTYNVAGAIDANQRIDMTKVTQAQQTSANFGTVTGAQVGSRRTVLSLRFKF
jgi:hypothetical protein